jgi:hypothetical protein
MRSGAGSAAFSAATKNANALLSTIQRSRIAAGELPLPPIEEMDSRAAAEAASAAQAVVFEEIRDALVRLIEQGDEQLRLLRRIAGEN